MMILILEAAREERLAMANFLASSSSVCLLFFWSSFASLISEVENPPFNVCVSPEVYFLELFHIYIGPLLHNTFF